MNHSVSQDEDNKAHQECRYCAELILARAKKCKHCGELVNQPGGWQQFFTKSVAYIGIATAFLSVFYALKEGYFYVQSQQQARDQITTYLNAADTFRDMDSLDYEQRALSQALELSPSNYALQRRLFLSQVEVLFRELDGQFPTEGDIDKIERYIMEGYRLLQLASKDQASEIKLMLARLLPLDKNWNDDASITELFEQVLESAPNSPEVMFHFGLWLYAAQIDTERGVLLLQQAAESEQINALYWYDYGRVMLEQENYEQAILAFQRGISIKDKQQSMETIRASNLGKTQLRQALLLAHRRIDIRSDVFFDLSAMERTALIEQVMSFRPSDKHVGLVAAQYYVSHQQFDLALTHLELLVTDDDLERPAKSYNVELMILYRDALIGSNSESELVATLDHKIQQYNQ